MLNGLTSNGTVEEIAKFNNIMNYSYHIFICYMINNSDHVK